MSSQKPIVEKPNKSLPAGANSGKGSSTKADKEAALQRNLKQNIARRKQQQKARGQM
ncbi:MAG: hypothetical protein K0U45_01670 [Alphaproteobacteria bacterium]|nr:hypothetical protein [Alphaproteobacteria bacterium]